MVDSEARYSLPQGEGDGAILGVAAGDSAGGAWELGYSAVTEQVTVLSYQLIEHGHLTGDVVTSAIRELDGGEGEEPVYRAESAQLRAWLDSASAGSPVADPTPGIDSAYRGVPVGVAFRRDPVGLVSQVIELETVFSSHAPSIFGGVVIASAVAASCFAQTGRDLIAGVAELAEEAVEGISSRPGLVETEALADMAGELRGLAEKVGVSDGFEALESVRAAEAGSSWHLVKAGLLLAAPVVERYHSPLEQAARIGGSPLGAAVGGIVGARMGIRAWPWAFANDTWFAEMGRRLARGPSQVDDLPIPYAVEQHLISGERRGLH